MARKAAQKIQEHVILLHGIIRSPRSMIRIQKALDREGYRVHNFGYRSTRDTIETVAGLLHVEVKKITGKGIRIHFVTHSLGSLVVRYYFNRYRIAKAGRIVMIAPPNRGSRLAMNLSRWKPYRHFFGHAGREVTGAPGTIPLVIPPPKREFGVIAGGLGFSIGINPFIAGDNDGTVGVEETKLPGMKDFVQVKGQHSLLLFQTRVIDNIIHFLKNGRFLR